MTSLITILRNHGSRIPDLNTIFHNSLFSLTIFIVFMFSCFFVILFFLIFDVSVTHLQQGGTSLSFAAQYGHTECTALLLTGGADVNAVLKVGELIDNFVWKFCL
jgi:ankyrin repeat protein